MNRFGSPFMAKNPLNQKKREQRLREKIEETRKKAYMRGTPDYTDEKYEESKGEKRAQRKLARLENRLDRVEKRNSALNQKEELTNKEKRKAKKVAKKAVKSMDKLRQAEEIEGRHGYGANKKSERKRKASERKKEKAKKLYKEMSASEKAYMEQEGRKMRQKK